MKRRFWLNNICFQGISATVKKNIITISLKRQPKTYKKENEFLELIKVTMNVKEAKTFANSGLKTQKLTKIKIISINNFVTLN